ncbi:MAG: efflux RND transporter periplasmic adaptor subunit [Deltaproteobacteria bacterium]|nr:efflux RND transporter periplasmic adaptor subunit [Deltaproteobacteria bacterium]
MKKWLKRIFLFVLVLAIAGGVTYAFLPQPLPVDAAAVRRGPLRVTVDAAGRTRARERYVVAAPILGTLARITLRAGDPVAAGDVVATIAPPPSPLLDARTRAELDARIAAAEAAEAQAAAAVDLADLARGQAYRERARARSLFETQALSRRDLDAAEFELRARQRDVDAAALAVETAHRQVEAVRATLAGTTGTGDAAAPVPVLSPSSGVVLAVLQENEGPVAPGTPLLAIADPAALEVVADFLTADAAQVTPGARVELRQWGGPQPLAGLVRRVEPAAFTKLSALGIEEQRVNVLIDPDPDAPWPTLGDGWRVEASVVVWESTDVLLAPSGAVFRDGDQWAVFVVAGGRAVRRPVQLGRRGAADVEVQAGLDAADVVVLHPSEKLEDGVEVETR